MSIAETSSARCSGRARGSASIATVRTICSRIPPTFTPAGSAQLLIPLPASNAGNRSPLASLTSRRRTIANCSRPEPLSNAKHPQAARPTRARRSQTYSRSDRHYRASVIITTDPASPVVTQRLLVRVRTAAVLRQSPECSDHARVG